MPGSTQITRLCGMPILQYKCQSFGCEPDPSGSSVVCAQASMGLDQSRSLMLPYPQRDQRLLSLTSGIILGDRRNCRSRVPGVFQLSWRRWATYASFPDSCPFPLSECVTICFGFFWGVGRREQDGFAFVFVSQQLWLYFKQLNQRTVLP